LTFLKGFAYQLAESCRAIDPTSTSETIRRATQRDSLREESSASEKAKVVPIEIIEPKVGLTEAEEEDFLAGLDLD
jgi:hypothetical protein